MVPWTWNPEGRTIMKVELVQARDLVEEHLADIIGEIEPITHL